MKVAIGCPVRNRAWVLPDYLSALEKEETDWADKEYIFLPNDCTDNTEDILKAFADKHENTIIESLTTHNPANEKRGKYSADQYAHLAYIRNKFIELFLTKTNAEFLLSVDSDIIVPPHIIHELYMIETRRPYTTSIRYIVGAAISNIENKVLDGHTPGNFMKRVKGTGRFIHPVNYPLETNMYKVDMVGAVSLIPRVVLQTMYNKNKGFVYKPHPQGEDLGFALNVPPGTEFYVNMDCRCIHRMKVTK